MSLLKASHEEREAFEVTRITGKEATFPDIEIPQLRSSLTQLALNTQKLAFRILKALALGMGLQQDYFVDRHRHLFSKLKSGTTRITLNNYLKFHVCLSICQ